MLRNLTNMQRFQVYKKNSLNGLIHINSILAASLGEAIKMANDTKTNGGGDNYYVTGLIRNTNEDISQNFPSHIQRRIINKGNKTKFKSTFYYYKNKKNTL